MPGLHVCTLERNELACKRELRGARSAPPGASCPPLLATRRVHAMVRGVDRSLCWISAILLAQLATSRAWADASTPGAPSATAVELARKKNKLTAVVLPGIEQVPGYRRVRVYTPPLHDAEPVLEPSDVHVVEVRPPREALVLARPASSPLLGAIVAGARVPVRGVVRSATSRGCGSKLWYAIDPWGYVCAGSVRPTAERPSSERVLDLPEGERVPFRYVSVGIPEGEKLPMWASLEARRRGEEPERELERGDTIAVEKTLRIEGEAHYVSVDGKLLPAQGTHFIGGRISAWKGETVDGKTTFPFGWITPERARLYAEPQVRSPASAAAAVLERRTRVNILGEEGAGAQRMLKIGEGRWLRAADVNEVRRAPRPSGVTPAAQWIDVDLGEQVLVAYEGDQPIYATLISSGRAIRTPRGDYPIWAKVTTISMKSQPYEEKSYFVDKVPWDLFFQAHNAIHGAYWHDRFGVSKSHGCINLAPLDARHLFEWVRPRLPPGWAGYRAPNLLEATIVHIHNSHAKRPWFQERPIGPPDKELEAIKLLEAEQREDAMAGSAEADAAAASAGGQPP